MTGSASDPVSPPLRRSWSRQWFTPILLTGAFLIIIAVAVWLWPTEHGGPMPAAPPALAAVAAMLALGMGYSLWRLKMDVEAHARAEREARDSSEEARRQERAFTHAVLESLPGVLYCYDDNLRIRRWNASFERVTSYLAAEILEMSPLDFFAESERPLVASRIGEVFAAGSSEVEADLLARDGTRTPYYFTVRAALIEGRRHLVGVGIDISSRRRAEAEVLGLHDTLRRRAEELEQRVAERTAELEIARDRAQEADRLKSVFLATMSHELRTPLNSVIGFTGILLQRLAGPLNDEQARQLGMVQGSARHLLELINDILDLSKIEAGEIRTHCEPFDLRASLERVAAAVRPMAADKGLALGVDVGPGPGIITSDRRRVEQVLLNLLNNAVKFTPTGSVTLTARFDGPSVTVAVADTGIGISRNDFAALFQPFHQIDSGLTRQHEGTGLGLAICRRLLTLLGGDIGVESEPGVGSVFTITLPVDAAGGATP